MFENPRRGRQAKNFSTNVPKILDLKSSSEQIFSKICCWVPMTLNRFLFVSNTVEALLADTLKGGRLYLRPPSQNPVFLNFHTNSVFLRYRKRSARVTDSYLVSWGCTQVTTASTVMRMPSFHIGPHWKPPWRVGLPP